MIDRVDSELISNAQMRRAIRLPYAEKGQRIGLFGGSFNPPHEGHVLVSEIALRRLGLDQVWWIVTPGNPLKDHDNLAPLAERIALCHQIANVPAIKITAFEIAHQARFTADTLALIKQYRPGNDFVWLMGADNLTEFHRWQRWREIANMMPFAVIDRPGSTLSSRSSMAALALARFRLDEADAALLPTMQAPAWVFIHGPRSLLSSTRLRAQKDGKIDDE